MKKIILLLVILLSGCVTRASLISQTGQRYEIQVDPISKKLATVVDGVSYSGTAVTDQSIGFGSMQSFGMKPTFATGTNVMMGSNGQALMVSANGGYIQCGFNKNGVTVIGRCESNDGRQFVLTTD